jgi:hypothetical protein
MLLFAVIPFLRKKVLEKLMNILKGLRFNNSIISITGASLDFTFSIVT